MSGRCVSQARLDFLTSQNAKEMHLYNVPPISLGSIASMKEPAQCNATLERKQNRREEKEKKKKRKQRLLRI
jgi:hypothetical protein